MVTYSQISSFAPSGISNSVSALLAYLILDPNISLSPYFFVIIVLGFATFTFSLGSSIAKKQSWEKYLWNIVGVCLAGYVVVSWARYASIFFSLLMLFTIIMLIIGALVFRRKKLLKNYGKYGALIVCLGLIIVGFFPVVAIAQNVGDSPLVVVSPLEKFLIIDNSKVEQSFNITIVSVYANAWDFKLTAEKNGPLLAIYLDNKENGPVEIPFLERGRLQQSELLIERSYQLPNGNYTLTLNFSYKDAIGKTYEDSAFVFLSNNEPHDKISATTWVIVLVSVVIIVVLALFIVYRWRRMQY